MLFQVLHVLINVDNLGVVRVHLLHEAINDFCELRVFFIDSCLLSLKLPADVCEELLKMLRVIHNEFVNNGLVQIH
jgi:hypothetical protein